MPPQQRAAVRFREDGSTVERVHEDRAPVVLLRSARESQEKVAGEVHAVHPDAGAARDFDVDHRQGNRNAGAAIEHLVQEAVSGVVVVAGVSGETLIIEEELVEGIDRPAGADPLGCGQAVRRGLAHRFQARQVGGGVQTGIAEARDEQGRRGQIRVGTRRSIGELLHQVGW